MAGWEEVNRLQAAFRDAQLSSTKQRLSERNVVEIVSKLIELKLIDVIYTLDGKEYLTPQELGKEIRDELIIHGGRINLVELQQILNVDLNHVETKVNELVRHDRYLTLVLGQLIDRTYLNRLAEEINDKLQEQGNVTIGELTQLYDLPADFISETVHGRLGSIIKGKVDSYDKNVIFTDAYVARMRSKIQGSFSAITRPTQLVTVLNQHDFQERLFYSILEDLVNKRRLAGSIAGGRQDKAIYVPDVYSKTQNDWVDSFYRQNGYLEYDSLMRLGITDPKGFIKKRYKTEPLVYMSTCCVGQVIRDQLEASVEDALSDGSWVDVMPLLPTIFSLGDANQLLTDCVKNRPGVTVCCDTIVVSDKFVAECGKPFTDLIQSKADTVARSNPALLKPEVEQKASTKSSVMEDTNTTKEDRREQRRKKAAGGGSTKSGGGLQGRETKTKSTKKKGRSREEDSDEESATSKGRQQELEFMSVEEIQDILHKQKELRECPDDLMIEIAHRLHRPLSREFQEAAKSIFLLTAGTASGVGRRKTHGELQEKILGLWTNAKLFDKGLRFFFEDTQTQLTKHLLKTVCTDVVNLVVNSLAMEHMLSVSDDSQLTAESRNKIINKLPENVETILSKLNKSLNGTSMDVFFQHFEAICDPAHLGIMLKKPDKKKERQLVFSHRQTLLEQIAKEEDPAMVLHLAAVILFQTVTQNIVHAPGRCVPQIVTFLRVSLDSEKNTMLENLQDLVVRHVKLQGEEHDEERTSVEATMSELVPKVREIAVTTKRTTAQQAPDE